MVLQSVGEVLEAVQNAVLIAFITVFDSAFGLTWAGSDSIAWAAIAAMLFILLFV